MVKPDEFKKIIGSMNDIKQAIADKKTPEIQKVKIVSDPYEFAKPLNDNSSTNALTNRPQTPNIILKNPIDRELRITGLSLILDSDSTKRAKLYCEILINRAEYFDKNKAGFFENIASYAVPLSNEGHKLQKDESIEIYLWSTDGTDIKVAASSLVQGRPQG